MLIEAFSAGKDPARPEANEDRLVVLPGRAYAVIDGVSARGPARYDGKLSGQFAADLVQRRLECGTADEFGDATALIQHLTDAIAAAYVRFGMSDLVRDDANPRFSTTLALVLEQGERIEILLVGDSGVRINGERVYQVNKDLDGITATLRGAAWAAAAGRSEDPELRERLSRKVVLHGTRQPAGEFSVGELQAIEAAAAAACARTYQAIPAELVSRLLRGGILNEQKHHQNNGRSPLGYSCLDGFPIPAHLIFRTSLDARDVHQVELFSDGYFTPAAGFGVAEWERRFIEVEAEDPAKVARFASVKGSLANLWADDRTYLGVQRDR